MDSHTVAELQARYGANVRPGEMMWARDGRRTGQGLGAGTGCPVYADTIAGVTTWRRLSDDTVVAA